MKVNRSLCETPNQIPFSLLPWGESCLVSEGPSYFPNLWLISSSTIPPRLYLLPFLCVLLREPKLTHPLPSITSWHSLGIIPQISVWPMNWCYRLPEIPPDREKLGLLWGNCSEVAPNEHIERVMMVTMSMTWSQVYKQTVELYNYVQE